MTPVWRGFQGNLNSQTNKWGPHKGEWPLWGEEEHGYRRNFPDEGKWSGVPVAPTTGQAEHLAVCLLHPPAPEGENRAEARTHLEAFLELLGEEKGWVENQAGERAGVMPPAQGTMSGSARPFFEDISDDTPSNQNISRKFG